MTLKWSLIFRFSERIQAFISICGLMVWVLYIYVTSRTNKQLWPIKVSIYPAHLTGHKKHIVLCQTKRLKVSLKKDTWSIKLIHGQRLPGIKKKEKALGAAWLKWIHEATWVVARQKQLMMRSMLLYCPLCTYKSVYRCSYLSLFNKNSRYKYFYKKRYTRIFCS